MDTYLTLEYGHRDPLPDGADSEVRTPDALVERFIEAYTEPGDRVFDPFAGFGTTLVTTERLGRIPFGIEFETERVDSIRDRLGDAGEVRQGDVLDPLPEWVPAVDCCVTSPPFATPAVDGNPFENYAGESTYADYLDDVETAFANVAAALTPGGTLVVDVVNMRVGDEVATLAWDVADRVRESLRFDGEVVVCWDGGGYPEREGNYGYGFDHSYCLVFEKEDG